MLPTTPDETATIRDYVLSQSTDDITVDFLQKVYAETLAGGMRHEIWDVHCSDGRWWVITNPTNLYSQKDFPNMDLCLTFHVGLIMRLPRSGRQQTTAQVEPFTECLQQYNGLRDALSQAANVEDCQAVGMRCRETLLAFCVAAQRVVPWTGQGDAPQKANLKAWADFICNETMPGPSRKARRSLCKTLLVEAWEFTNSLTHSKSCTHVDAEAAVSATETAIDLAITTVIRHARHVPEECPGCGSPNLSPETATNDQHSGVRLERPVCSDCGWRGDAVVIAEGAVSDDCIIPTVPLRDLPQH